MQKALELMNIKVHDVISDLVGESGQRMLRAILGGERNARKLVELYEGSIVSRKGKRLEDALLGTWAAQHLFALKQAWEAWKFCRRQIEECDGQIRPVIV